MTIERTDEMERVMYAALAKQEPGRHHAALRKGLDAVLAIVERDRVNTEPIHLPWSYWDGVVETELRVNDYPYGGGVAGSGVQITLGQRRDGQIIAVRLPRESARRLALAILGGPERKPGAEHQARLAEEETS